ncbi:MAG: phosphoribosylamine--glycine ligase, partial [Actinobacteria bacterium]|nr:phosphoribosylamine--glycine ligase [Actinomycetota bacterium]
MKVMVIGSGAREHCLVWKISRSSYVDKIYAVPGNAGISEIAECVDLGIGKDSFNDLVNFAEDKKIDLTVVGPEAPLVDGIVDFFTERGFKIFGPTRDAAMLEGSKVFTKRLLQKYKIPTPDGVVFGKEEYEDALSYVESISDESFPVVVKADGLAAGKGVVIAEDREKAIEAIRNCFVKKIFGDSGSRIIIEEFLVGFEVSILCLCDGETIIPMALAQDYKRIYEGDRGKNTGGMGSYSPVPSVTHEVYERILNEIIYPTYRAIKEEGICYKGILYGGLLISDGKPYLLEYNCRFGDPETQAILPRLEDDLVPLLLACVYGELNERSISWDNQKCVC